MDIFLSPLSTHWTEWEITILSRTTTSLRHLSCTTQSAGPDPWNLLLRKGNIYSLLPENHGLWLWCQIHHKSTTTELSPQVGNAISLWASSVSLLLWLSRKTIWHSTGTDTAPSALNLPSGTNSTSCSALENRPFSLVIHSFPRII